MLVRYVLVVTKLGRLVIHGPLSGVERKTTLRNLFLLGGHFSIRVEQFNTLTICSKGKGSFVTGDALVGKVLEDLLQSRLCHTVLLDAHVALFLFESTKEPAYSLVFLGHSELEVLSALLKQLHLFEVASEVHEDLEAVRLAVEKFEQVSQAHIAIVQLSLKR